jgi:hypothetical protein
MATTTNYGWETPDNTDLVKDGALAMRDLGGDIDTTLYTALGGAYPGLRLVKKQTIGSAVSSVTVTNAFSATYENYRIIVSGGVASSNAAIAVRLGATATGYDYAQMYMNYGSNTITGFSALNQAQWLVGSGTSNNLDLNVELKNPFTAKHSLISSVHMNNFPLTAFGTLSNTTSYTDLVILPSAGTMTGGTIYVYGYGAS